MDICCYIRSSSYINYFYRVKIFERLEKWMAIIKIAAIIGFIVIAILVILGFIKGGLYKAQIPRDFKDWFPNGLKGTLSF